MQAKQTENGESSVDQGQQYLSEVLTGLRSREATIHLRDHIREYLGLCRVLFELWEAPPLSFDMVIEKSPNLAPAHGINMQTVKSTGRRIENGLAR